jgi:hypothetical protein
MGHVTFKSDYDGIERFGHPRGFACDESPSGRSERTMTWIGRKKLALVPLFRQNAHPPDQIRQTGLIRFCSGSYLIRIRQAGRIDRFGPIYIAYHQGGRISML